MSADSSETYPSEKTEPKSRTESSGQENQYLVTLDSSEDVQNLSTSRKWLIDRYRIIEDPSSTTPGASTAQAENDLREWKDIGIKVEVDIPIEDTNERQRILRMTRPPPWSGIDKDVFLDGFPAELWKDDEPPEKPGPTMIPHSDGVLPWFMAPDFM